MCQICGNKDHSLFGETGSTTTWPAMSGSSVVYTADQVADYLTEGFWSDVGLSYRSYDISAGDQLTVNLTGLNSAGKNTARDALESWTALTGIEFVETTGNAQITFDDNKAGAWANSTVSGHKIISTHVNVDSSWVNYDGYYLQTYIHEIGHALGLGHPGNYNSSADIETDTHFANDSWQMSVMSYFSQYQNTNVDASYSFLATAQMADLLAIQKLYGTASTIALGDTGYGDGDTSGRVGMDLSGDWSVLLVDNGGIDTIDLGSRHHSQRLDLNAESYSDLNGKIGNFSIARGTVIENAVTGSGADEVIGNSADNRLETGSGADTIAAGDGDDLLIGEGGADRLTGGSGSDIFQYEVLSDAGDTITDFSLSEGDTVDVSPLLDAIGYSGSDPVSDGTVFLQAASGGSWLVIDHYGTKTKLVFLSGVSAGEDVSDIIDMGAPTPPPSDPGTGSADTIYTFSDSFVSNWTKELGTVDDTDQGVDTLDLTDVTMKSKVSLENGSNNKIGSKSLSLSETSDIENVLFGSGADMGFGNAADNLMEGNGGNDKLYGKGGNDIIFGGEGRDALYGGAGDDQITSGGGRNRLYGGEGNDTIVGGDEKNSFYGGAGDDSINAGSGDDKIDAGEGSNIINAGEGKNSIKAKGGDDVASSGAGDDKIDLGEGSNTVNAGGGKNQVKVGAGDDVVTSGDGDDKIDVGEGSNQVSAGDGKNTIKAKDGNDLITSGSEADKIDAGGGNNAVNAGGGANQIKAKDGDDTVFSGDGADKIDVGNGRSLINAGAGNNQIKAGVGTHQITTGNGDDRISVKAGDSVIDAGDGKNQISVTKGNVELTAGSGDDAIRLGDGNHDVSVGDGKNSVSLGDGNSSVVTGNGADRIKLGDGDGTVVSGAGNDQISVGDGNFDITAGDGINKIQTGTGAMTITSGDGVNSIKTKDGNDTITVGDGGNTVSTGKGNDTVEAGAGNDKIYTGSGMDSISGGAGHDYIKSDKGDDFLFGGAGADTLDGGTENDILSGGAGADYLIGGRGSDVFVFASSDEAGDRIKDFSWKDGDTLDVDDLLLEFGTNTEDALEDGSLSLVRGPSSSSSWLVFDADGEGGDLPLEIALLDRVKTTEDLSMDWFA